jgi:hypothetical protein
LLAGLQSVYACLAARSSAHEGRFVHVRQVGEMAPPRRNGKNHARTTTPALTPAS